MIGIPDEKNASRRESTTTLQRLLLVAQALETELDTRRQTDVNGGRVVFSIRMVNMVSGALSTYIYLFIQKGR
jgi:hypothetical protein